MTKRDKQKIAAELRSIAQMLEKKKAAIPKLEDADVSMEGLKSFLEKYNQGGAWRTLETAYENAIEKYQEEAMGQALE